jgi:hypothetical protein
LIAIELVMREHVADHRPGRAHVVLTATFEEMLTTVRAIAGAAAIAARCERQRGAAEKPGANEA